jgi:hypothetical protein
MFKLAKSVEVYPAEFQRLTDLSLAMVIPWADGFPQFIGDVDTPQGRRRILEATKNERLPWSRD